MLGRIGYEWDSFHVTYIHIYIYIYTHTYIFIYMHVEFIMLATWFDSHFFLLMFTSMLLLPLLFLLLSCNGFFLTSILNPIFLHQMAWSTFSFKDIFRNNFQKHSHRLKQVSIKKVLSLFGSLLRISSRRKKFVRFLKYLREYSLLQIFK